MSSWDISISIISISIYLLSIIYLLHSNARSGSSQKAGSFTMKSDLLATAAAQSYQIRGKNSLHDFGFFEKFLSTFGGLALVFLVRGANHTFEGKKWST